MLAHQHDEQLCEDNLTLGSGLQVLRPGMLSKEFLARSEHPSQGQKPFMSLHLTLDRNQVSHSLGSFNGVI